MAITCPVGFDVDRLNEEVRATYERVAREPHAEFHFHRGGAFACDLLGYDPTEVEALPAACTEPFAGVANPHVAGPVLPGDTVLDVGCGAGMDLLLAARRAGPRGRTIGVDPTPAMRRTAVHAAAAAGLTEVVEVRGGNAEALPVHAESVDVVQSNGVLNLAPDKERAFAEIFRVLRPGGRLHLADVVIRLELKEDDRRDFWGGGLDTSKIFVFDVHTDPAKPRLHKVIDDFVSASGGAVGPHGHYALPGRMLISALSNDKDHGGRTALVEYSNSGRHIATHWVPTDDDPRGATIEKAADGYGYDVRVLPRKNVMFSSSFTGWSNYMMDFAKMLQDEEAMKRFGQTVVVWDLHARKPKKVLDVPGAPLEIRVAWGPNHDYAFTSSALTSKLWLIYEDDAGEWQAEAVADIGDPAKIPLPVDMSLSSDDGRLWVNTFMDGKARLFDVSDPFHPKQIYEKTIGTQVNMVSQSWDGERLYFTSSLLANWDKQGDDDEQFLRAYRWNGEELVQDFEVDFYAENLGRPHLMRFGAYALYDGGARKAAAKTAP